MKTLRNILLLTALLIPSVVQPMKRKSDPINQEANKRPKIQTPAATLEEPQLNDTEWILPDNFLDEVCLHQEPFLKEYSSGPQWIFVDESEEILAEYNSIGHLVEQSTDEEVSNIKIDTGDNKYSLQTNQQYSYQNYPYSQHGGVSYGAFAPQQVTIYHNPVTIINNIVQPIQHEDINMYNQQTTSSIDMIKLRWQDAKPHEWIELPSTALSHALELRQFSKIRNLTLNYNKLTVEVICDCLIEIDRNSADYQYSQKTFNIWFTQRCQYIGRLEMSNISTAGDELDIKQIENYTLPSKKTFKCPQEKCWVSCANLSKLKAHMRTHTQEKPFSCPYCDYRANQRSLINTHIKNKHK